MARRKRDDVGERRTERVNVRLTPSGKALLAEQAADQGLEVSEYVRLLVAEGANRRKR